MRLPIQIEAILFKRIDGEIQFLLLKRIPRSGEFWQPITGGLEGGETIMDALKREIREETGIENIVRIIENVHYFEFRDIPFIEHLKKQGQTCEYLKEYVFGVEVALDEVVDLDREEHSEYNWCGFEEALGMLKWSENKEALKKLNEILT
jgi:dATP pyrophosphohydrolase